MVTEKSIGNAGKRNFDTHGACTRICLCKFTTVFYSKNVTLFDQESLTIPLSGSKIKEKIFMNVF